jgi:hypothetical protein
VKKKGFFIYLSFFFLCLFVGIFFGSAHLNAKREVRKKIINFGDRFEAKKERKKAIQNESIRR